MSPRRGLMLLVLLVAAALAVLVAVLRSAGESSSTEPDPRVVAAIRAHNGSFAPSKETLRAWALFDDVRCSLHVTDESPPRVVVGAALESGSWFVIYVAGGEVDYDSYRESTGLDAMAAQPGVGDPERFFATGTPCSVGEGGVLRLA